MTSVGSIGLELELLAPEGKTRFDLARALAREVGGALRLGWKYHGRGHLADGRPDCELTPAARVTVKGEWFASLVDDPTIVDDLRVRGATRSPRAAPRGASSPGHHAVRHAARTNRGMLRVLRADDLRLAAWVERRCGHSLRELMKAFDAREDELGFVDPWGLPLVRWGEVDAERARVCELVLRPLSTKELGPTLRRVMKLARARGFTVPSEAAVHAHFDAAPFRSARALRRLVLAWTDERERWLRVFQPNPKCRKLGPFPPDVVRVAREAGDDLEFATLAAAMLLAGLKREVDLNLLGLVERYPKQPTLEVRCLPGSLEPEATLLRLEQAAHFLSRILRR